MIIKKFQAKTENEAVEQAKKELGNNVVIMNVRNVKRKGLFSFLRPQLTEVTVALEEESETKYVSARKPEPGPETVPVGENSAGEKQQPLVEAIAKPSSKPENNAKLISDLEVTEK